MEYDENGPPLPSSGPTPCLIRPSAKPPYSKQCGNTNLHDMFPYEFVEVHVHAVDTMVVPFDDNTDDQNHDNNDLHDASYEMETFDIGSPVGTIQAYACMEEKVRMRMDKWFYLNQKTKKIWDQTDDNDSYFRLF
jgi:hypothetical protein